MDENNETPDIHRAVQATKDLLKSVERAAGYATEDDMQMLASEAHDLAELISDLHEEKYKEECWGSGEEEAEELVF